MKVASFIIKSINLTAINNSDKGRRDNHMDENFPINRYHFSDLVEHLQKLETFPDIVTDSETEIEFYGGNTIPKEDFIRLLAHFNEIDNLAQNDAKQDYEEHPQFGVKSYQFEPSWVEVSADSVCVEYVGHYINTDFNLTFKYINGIWVLKK